MIKKFFTIIAIVASIATAHAQVKIEKMAQSETISKVSALGITRFSLSRSIIGTDTLYNFIYPNNSIKGHDESFQLVASSADMLNIEDVMLNIIKNKNSKEDFMMELGDKKYYLRRNGNFGFPNLLVLHNEYDSFYISDKEIKKIFAPFHK